MLSQWCGSEVYSTIRDAHERLEAVDPDYTLLFIYHVRHDSKPAELAISFKASRHATPQDRHVMDSICLAAEKELQEEDQ